MSLVAFGRSLQGGARDVGGVVVVGLPLDRVAARDAGRAALFPALHAGDAGDAGAPSGPLPASPAPAAAPGRVPPRFARRCVAAAWQAAGLGAGDDRIDSLAARSRSSALLPETRLRAMRLWTDAAHATTLATTSDTSYYDAIGANLVLEVRLTWRLDRLLFAGDEPALERMRFERQEARSRLATRTLEVLFAWERARAEAAAVDAGSPAQADADLRTSEAEATLDVLTGGWFTSEASP